jgi:hypothetical protein
MRPSLQTSRAAARVAAGAPHRDCSRGIAGVCADTRPSSRDGPALTPVGPGSGSRGSRHRSAAWPAASVAVAHADRPEHCSTLDAGPVNVKCLAARHRRLSMAGRSAPGHLSETRPAPHPYNLGEGKPPQWWRSSSLRRRRPPGRGSNQTSRLRRRGWSILVSTPGSIPVSVKAPRCSSL